MGIRSMFVMWINWMGFDCIGDLFWKIIMLAKVLGGLPLIEIMKSKTFKQNKPSHVSNEYLQFLGISAY
jgi:hypothetical protein